MIGHYQSSEHTYLSDLSLTVLFVFKGITTRYHDIWRNTIN